MKNKKLSKILGLTLCAILAAGILASCSASDNGSKATDNTSASESENSSGSESKNGEMTESTFSPNAKAADKNTGSPTPVPQTAEEAANDTTAIANEIASIQELIDEELYDDALMQIRALSTKNLSAADQKIVEEYQALIEEKMSGGLSD